MISVLCCYKEMNFIIMVNGGQKFENCVNFLLESKVDKNGTITKIVNKIMIWLKKCGIIDISGFDVNHKLIL